MWGARDVTFPMRLPVRLAAVVRRFAADASGTTAIEYALLILIGVAILVAVGQIADSVKPMYEQLVGKFGN